MGNDVVKQKTLPWMLLCVVSTAIILAQGRIIDRQKQANFVKFSKPFSFEIPYFGLTYTGESGNLIDDRVLQFGAFEKPELFLLKEIVGDRRGLVFLDVGANTGVYALFMAPLVERVHAVEPFPPVLEKLRRNLEKNGLRNIDVHPVGFGNQKGRLPFHAPPASNHGVGSFSSDFAKSWRASGSEEALDGQLPLEIGDQYLQEHGITRVDILKIDIEGYEKFALQGLQQTMQRSRPHILMELNTHNAEGFHTLEELRATFPPHYDFFIITYGIEDMSSGRYDLVALSQLPSTQVNIVAVPQERARNPHT